MGFDTVVAEAALRVFAGNVQLAAQTLAHHGGSLPPDLQFSGEDSSSTPSTSPSDSAGRSGSECFTHGGTQLEPSWRPRGIPRVPPGQGIYQRHSWVLLLSDLWCSPAGTSSASTDEDMETEAVNEILEDIPEHEEDYLDSTLEDEEVIIAEYLSYVDRTSSATKDN